MHWFITTNGYIKANKKNAGSKAPRDVAEICKRMGMRPLVFPFFSCDTTFKLYRKIWLMTVGAFPWIKVFLKVHKGDIILYQHPLYGNRLINRMIPFIKKHRGCKFIALIHDLESLRKGTGVTYSKEKTNNIADNILLKHFDVVICHNSVMKEYLASQGFDTQKVVCLGVFDYLTDYTPSHYILSQIPSIAIAGNLSPSKSNYLYRIAYPKNVLTVHLYGVEYAKDMASDSMIYHGSFEPEELPDHLVGDFGLVWDGCSIETCAGNTGEYLRFNNPHKISLYLASNMPVIVWEESALAEYVRKNNFGLVISSLSEIPEKIRALSQKDYKSMCKAASQEGEKLRNGYYTERALGSAMRIIGK